MLRNREVRIFFAACLSLSAILSVVAFIIDLGAGIVALLMAVFLCTTFLLFTLYRYREIQKLSDYLAKIRCQETPIEIRDSREGELSILKDDIYKLTLTLSEQSELLKKDRAYLADSLADISHQLKTPLTSMLVMADLLSSSQLTEEKRQEFTDCIRSQLERIEWLVSSLLKMSKIDAGAIQFKRNDISIQSLIERALEPVRIPMELREQTLTLEGDSDTTLLCDPAWTTEALVNIIKNCVEHTPLGGALHIQWTENPLHWELVLSDNGSGISKEDLPHIFERFYKGRNAAPDSVGIGLAMAKSILHGQNADIFVKSEPELGTQFTLKFYKQVI